MPGRLNYCSIECPSVCFEKSRTAPPSESMLFFSGCLAVEMGRKFLRAWRLSVHNSQLFDFFCQYMRQAMAQIRLTAPGRINNLEGKPDG